MNIPTLFLMWLVVWLVRFFVPDQSTIGVLLLHMDWYMGGFAIGVSLERWSKKKRIFA